MSKEPYTKEAVCEGGLFRFKEGDLETVCRNPGVVDIFCQFGRHKMPIWSSGFLARSRKFDIGLDNFSATPDTMSEGSLDTMTDRLNSRF